MTTVMTKMELLVKANSRDFNVTLEGAKILHSSFDNSVN